MNKERNKLIAYINYVRKRKEGIKKRTRQKERGKRIK